MKNSLLSLLFLSYISVNAMESISISTVQQKLDLEKLLRPDEQMISRSVVAPVSEFERELGLVLSVFGSDNQQHQRYGASVLLHCFVALLNNKELFEALKQEKIIIIIKLLNSKVKTLLPKTREVFIQFLQDNPQLFQQERIGVELGSLNAALILECQTQNTEGIAALKSALDKTSTTTRINTLTEKMVLHERRLDLCVQTMIQDHAPSWFNRGAAYFQEGSFDEAESFFRLAILDDRYRNQAQDYLEKIVRERNAPNAARGASAAIRRGLNQENKKRCFFL